MGFVMIMGPCAVCGNIFSYNPSYVPSLKNQPFCGDCMESINILRASRGVSPLVVHPDAYEPLPEEEL